MSTQASKVDAYGVRFGQGLVGSLTLAAFAFEIRPIVPVLAGILSIGALFGLRYAPFGFLYRGVVKPLTGLDGPREHAAPKRFAQVMGASFLGLSAVGLYATTGIVQLAIGWGFAFLVAALALLAAITDYCLACQMYGLFRRFASRTGAADA